MAPTVRSFSAEFEPLRLIARFPEIYPGLLESHAHAATVTGGARAISRGGRFDILPISAGQCLRLGADRSLSGPHSRGAAGFLSALEEWWEALRLPSAAAPLPFTGGWLLYLGYELATEIEPRLALPTSPDSLIALAIRTPAAWIRDRTTLQAWLVAEPGFDALLDRFETHVRESRGPTPVLRRLGFDVLEEDPAQFLEAVSRALGFIAAGDVYQANLSREWRVASTAPVDPVAIYERLRSTNPSPFAAMMRYGN
ncbi:MAG: chorismate-binding protein, partial [Pseudomonadota bacterium]|nr:chorismate-binding protein [Pseudomonadota bacterium]